MCSLSFLRLFGKFSNFIRAVLRTVMGEHVTRNTDNDTKRVRSVESSTDVLA